MSVRDTARCDDCAATTHGVVAAADGIDYLIFHEHEHMCPWKVSNVPCRGSRFQSHTRRRAPARLTSVVGDESAEIAQQDGQDIVGRSPTLSVEPHLSVCCSARNVTKTVVYN